MDNEKKTKKCLCLNKFSFKPMCCHLTRQIKTILDFVVVDALVLKFPECFLSEGDANGKV